MAYAEVPYCLPSDVFRVGLAASAWEGIDPKLVTDTILDVSGEIDGYLQRFSPPLVSVPRVIRMICAIRTAWRLARAINRDSSVIDENLVKDFDLTTKQLGEIRDGTLFLAPLAVDSSPDVEEMAPRGWSDPPRGWGDGGIL